AAALVAALPVVLAARDARVDAHLARAVRPLLTVVAGWVAGRAAAERHVAAWLRGLLAVAVGVALHARARVDLAHSRVAARVRLGAAAGAGVVRAAHAPRRAVAVLD